MKFKHNNRVLPAAACAALATAGFVVATPAQAVDFTLHGQVNRAITAVDNGEDSDVGFVDNTDWNSRFTLSGSQKMDNGATVGFTWQVGLTTNDSYSWDVNKYSTDYGAGSSNDTWDDRIAEVWIKGQYGKLSFGKVDSASDGTAELNYSPTTYESMSSVSAPDIAGGVTGMWNDGVAYDGTNYTLGSVYNNFDGFSRQQGIVYITPSFNGFTLSGGVYEGHAFDIVPRYEYSFGNGGKFGIALDYADSQDLGSDIAPDGTVLNENNRFKEYGGSTSLLLPSGLNFAITYKHRDFQDPISVAPGDDNDSADFYYGSIGYIMGKHAFAVDYGDTEDLLNDGSSAKSLGVGYTYDWNKSITLYASYHHYWLDDMYRPGAGDKEDAQGINQLFAGVRLQFL